ncbi:hypothetical protein Q2941_23190 [Bradyrhizobium sp. UFLA05-153]|nr:hypothetical protein [Bradyrhizobium sp. Ec3.3]
MRLKRLFEQPVDVDAVLARSLYPTIGIGQGRNSFRKRDPVAIRGRRLRVIHETLDYTKQVQYPMLKLLDHKFERSVATGI